MKISTFALLIGMLGCSTMPLTAPGVDLGKLSVDIPSDNFVGADVQFTKATLDYRSWYGFSRWSGKNGPLKPGFSFQPED